MIDVAQTHRFPTVLVVVISTMLLSTLLVVWWMKRARIHNLEFDANNFQNTILHTQGYPIEKMPATAKYLHYVATFPMYGDSRVEGILPSTAGFLTQDDNCFMLHDWHDGHLKWKVTAPNLHGWGRIDTVSGALDNSAFALSCDGRYFAASTVQKDGVRVQRWHNGLVDGDCVVLASPGRAMRAANYGLAITNHGHLFLQYNFEESASPSQYLLALDGYRVLASATLPGQAHIITGGRMVIDDDTNSLYSLQVIGDRLLVTRVAQIANDAVQYTDSYLLTARGAVYSSSGQSLPPSPSRYFDDDNRDCRTSDWQVFHTDGNQYRIFSLASHDSWSFCFRPGLDRFASSADGRYVLLHENYSSTTDALWLYQRPGILRAVLRYDPDISEQAGDRVFTDTCRECIFAPNGRSVILKYSLMGAGGDALLYQW